MRTISIIKNANNQIIHLPKDMEYQGVNELEIIKSGDEIILRPVRPNWVSFHSLTRADDDFMVEREDVLQSRLTTTQSLKKSEED